MASSELNLLGVAAAAKVLGVTPSRVRQLADQGLLHGLRTTSGVRIFRAPDVHKLAKKRREAVAVR